MRAILCDANSAEAATVCALTAEKAKKVKIKNSSFLIFVWPPAHFEAKIVENNDKVIDNNGTTSKDFSAFATGAMLHEERRKDMNVKNKK